jgi:hypothetical protein
MIAAVKSAPQGTASAASVSAVPARILDASAEMTLLLACANSRTDPASIEPLASQALDWANLWSLSQQHGVAPLLCRGLNGSPTVVPREVGTTLQAHFRSTAQANLLRAGELLRVADKLQAQNISVIPYKGPSLAVRLYGDVALREFSDLDLLIRPDELVPAREVLLRAGYRPELSLTADQEVRYLRSACEYNFIHDHLGILLELHWQILPQQFSLEFDLERLWGRCRRLRLGSSTVLSLSGEDLLLVLCAHAAKHLWARLIWIADIAGLVNSSRDLDCDLVFAEAERMGAARLLTISLLLADILFHIDLPDSIRPRIAGDARAARIASSLAARMLHSCGAEQGRAAAHLTLVLARERWQDRARYAWRTITARRRPFRLNNEQT